MTITETITSTKEPTLVLRLQNKEENLLNSCSRKLSLSKTPLKEKSNCQRSLDIVVNYVTFFKTLFFAYFIELNFNYSLKLNN